jgi:hypothetical protein
MERKNKHDKADYIHKSCDQVISHENASQHVNASISKGCELETRQDIADRTATATSRDMADQRHSHAPFPKFRCHTSIIACFGDGTFGLHKRRRGRPSSIPIFEVEVSGRDDLPLPISTPGGGPSSLPIPLEINTGEGLITPSPNSRPLLHPISIEPIS